MLIRPCELSDIPMITTIYANAVANSISTFEVDPPTEQEMIRRRGYLLAKNYPYLVAEIDGVVAGYTYAGEYRERPAFISTVEDSIYVHEDFQGKGIGKALLNQLIDEAGQRDFRQMIAVVGNSANEGSIKLHVSLGFELIGTLKSVGWKHGRWVDTVLLQRPLGKANACPFPYRVS